MAWVGLPPIPAQAGVSIGVDLGFRIWDWEFTIGGITDRGRPCSLCPDL